MYTFNKHIVPKILSQPNQNQEIDKILIELNFVKDQSQSLKCRDFLLTLPHHSV